MTFLALLLSFAAGAQAKVVLVSLDGAQPAVVRELGPSLPELSRLARAGSGPLPLAPVFPSQTAPGHYALLTGAYPDANGIVANVLPKPNRSGVVTAFGVRSEAETLIEAAARQGKSVVAVAWVVSPRDVASPNARVVGFGRPEGKPSRLAFKAEDWKPAAASGWKLDGCRTAPDAAALELFDGVRRYELLSSGTAFYLDDDRDCSNGTLATLAPGGIASFPAPGHPELGLIVRLEASGPASDGALVVGPPYAFEASSSELKDEVLRAAGPFPGPADREPGAGPPEAMLREWQAVDDWLAKVTAYLDRRYAPDLLLSYQTEIDAAGHAFMLTDPRQPGYTEEEAKACAARRREAYRHADENLAKMTEGKSTVIVISDHGMAPIRTTVQLNRFLMKAGLAARCRGGGGAVHVDARGADPAKVAKTLKGLKDADGEAVLEEVLTRERLAEVHLSHPRSGDLVAAARLGYALACDADEGPILEPADERGTHGYLPSHPEMQALFVGTLKDAAPKGLVDVAWVVSRALGIEPPRGAR